MKRFDWFIERIQTRVAFGWLSERSAEKTSCPRTFQKTRLANRTMPSPYEGFLWRENEESMFWSFHPLADETNNEHLPKPFFKVTRKSLYRIGFLFTDRNGDFGTISVTKRNCAAPRRADPYKRRVRYRRGVHTIPDTFRVGIRHTGFVQIWSKTQDFIQTFLQKTWVYQIGDQQRT